MSGRYERMHTMEADDFPTPNVDVETADPEALKDRIDAGEEITLLDTRMASDYEEWRIDGENVTSINVPYFEFLDDEIDEDVLDRIPEDRLRSPARPESGLVTIDVDDPAATVDRLAAAGIVVRALPSPNAIRASVHAVNTESEVDRLVDALDPEWA